MSVAAERNLNTNETPSDHEPSSIPNGVADAPPQRSRLRRLAPLVLVAGLLGSTLLVTPHIPRERQIELRLDDSADIVSVGLDWSAASGRLSLPNSGREEPLQGSSWHFAAGTAPRSLSAKVRLPDGAYRMSIRVDRNGRVQTVDRTVTLGDADTISVPVR